jgi:hypothetical protein
MADSSKYGNNSSSSITGRKNFLSSWITISFLRKLYCVDSVNYEDGMNQNWQDMKWRMDEGRDLWDKCPIVSLQLQ